MNFNSTNLNPSNANNRAHGFQVRCLQAFTGTLIFIRRAAPGYRSNGTGALAGVGNEGSGWSSGFSGTNGVYLLSDVSRLNPSYASHRAHGFQVQCLQVFTGALIFIFHLKNVPRRLQIPKIALSLHCNRKNGPFVYRLGHKIFILGRGVRFS